MCASRKIPNCNFVFIKYLEELGNSGLGEVHTDDTDDHKILNNQIPKTKNQKTNIKVPATTIYQLENPVFLMPNAQYPMP